MTVAADRFEARWRAGLLSCIGSALVLAPAFSILAAERDDAGLADAAMERQMQTVRSLVSEGIGDVNALGRYDTAALHWIVRVQDLQTAEVLLAAGADPNLPTGLGVRPLHLAIDNGDVDMVKRLLDAGADPAARGRTEETPLFMAARVGRLAIMEELLDRNVAVDEGEPKLAQTPLMVAIRSGHAGAARLLIHHGADVNAQTAAGPEPAWMLPRDNLATKGVGINRGGWPERGQRPPIAGAKTPLHYATRQGHYELTRLLIEAGAGLEKADANGITPLLNAIINMSIASRAEGNTDHLRVAHFVIDQGANVNAIDWYGQTPLFAAVNIRNLDVRGDRGPTRENKINRDEAFKLIQVLLEHGADPNSRTREHPPERQFITSIGDLSWVDFTGQTPFLRAALAGDVRTMRLLLEHGADANISTFQGTTPLMAAAGINWVVNQTYDEGPESLLEAVELAYALGNDVNEVNSMGLTAVHGAANRGSNEIIEFLFEKGARLDVADKEGRTPITWAEGVFLATHPPVRKPETIVLLERLGASRADSSLAATENQR